MTSLFNLDIYIYDPFDLSLTWKLSWRKFQELICFVAWTGLEPLKNVSLFTCCNKDGELGYWSLCFYFITVILTHMHTNLPPGNKINLLLHPSSRYCPIKCHFCVCYSQNGNPEDNDLNWVALAHLGNLHQPKQPHSAENGTTKDSPVMSLKKKMRVDRFGFWWHIFEQTETCYSWEESSMKKSHFMVTQSGVAEEN